VKWFIDAMFFGASTVPAVATPICGRALGWFIGGCLRLRRQTILQHMTYAFPDLSSRDRRKLVRGFYCHMGMTILECLRLPRMNGERAEMLASVDGQEHLDRALAKGKGVLGLSGHIGNWELGLAQLSMKGYDVHAVVKEIKGATGAYMAQRLRSAHGGETIPRRKAALVKILRALRQNGIVMLVLDQNMTADEGVFVDFFGRRACTMTSLATLAKRYDVPVVPISIYREENLRRHRIVCLPEIPWESGTGSMSDGITQNTQVYTHALEQIIRQHPAQWLWLHRRWRTQPAVARSDEPIFP